MRDYGKLAPTFWIRGSGKRLRGHPEAQVIAAYLSTSPGANMVGIYYVPIDTISHDTGIDRDRVREALHRIEEAGYAKYDHDAELAWVPNHAKIEIGPVLKPGDKRRARVVAELARVDDHPFADEFLERYAVGFDLQQGASAKPGRGIEGASGQLDGASGELGQDRSGQDRSVTGQDRSTAPQLALAVPEGDAGYGRSKRGSRLPEGWLPSEATQTWAREQGVDPIRLVDEFHDYWRAVPGAKGVKLDWDATFRNRVRDVAGRPSGKRVDTRQPLRNPEQADWMKASGGDL